MADYDGFKKRRRESQKRGKFRGFGICCMLEHSGGAPVESAKLSFPGDGTLLLTLNVQNTGQGHATVFPRVIAERLGIPADKIPHTNGDSSIELPGYASVGSRSAMTAGHSIVKAMDTILQKGKPIAAAMLETGEADIIYKNGNFEVVGTDRRVTLFDVAARATEMKKRGEIAEDLDTKSTTETPLTFPNGVHIAEVEIDPDTGHMTIATYTAVDDCGRALDHMIVEGQLHGSVAAGLRPGADGEHGLRYRQRPAGHRLVHGLRHAARRRHAAAARRAPRRAGDHQSARRQRRRRGRHHGGDFRGDERRRRRHSGRRRRAPRHAGLGAAAVGSLPARQTIGYNLRRDETPSEMKHGKTSAADDCSLAGILLSAAAQAQNGRAHRQGDFGARADHGRRAGQRQARRHQRHHHRRHQRAGIYSFPADKLAPGHYTITIRAVGYKLDGPKAADVTADAATTADITLNKTNALANQLSNGEWLNSLPGADKVKATLTNCVGCHTLQRIVQSTHDAAEFMQVFKRMGTYSPGSTPTHPQPLLPGGNNSDRSPMPASMQKKCPTISPAST